MSPALSSTMKTNIRKSWVALSFLIFFIFTGMLVAADSAEELYRKGNASYEKGDYEKAVFFYGELIRIDEVSGENWAKGDKFFG